jgi:hypothetical protein
MPRLLTASSMLQCPHGGMVSISTTNTQARAGGAFLARSSDLFTIAGCPLNVAGAPHPCVRVQWVQTALRSKAVGDATLTEASVGLCLAADGAPQGAVLVGSTQVQVSGQ